MPWWANSDALSDDGQHSITLIAVIGSVFSPRFRMAHGGGHGGDPCAYCSLNVALYGRGGKRWAMTDQGRENTAPTRTRCASADPA